jgi:hypothetical protein
MRITLPGIAFVILPCLMTGTPFTSTYCIPSDNCLGFSNVATSVMVSGLKTATSAHIPVLMMPRYGGIFEALDEFGVAAVVRPGRNEGREAV